MSIENLLNPISTPNNQDGNSAMPSDEQLIFNTPNPNITNEAIQESFEKINNGKKDEPARCFKGSFLEASFEALSALKMDVHNAQEQDKIQRIN
ncbi:hypothetical protein O181_005217 [Austropuccinia psidii MF-1]|uniref:Uncharacterized protein n=1 Tax=Austropuccinia psidii MF-1 TaxID=1389203 RepID=A0A9Q3BHP6_9BASI|nr:hypothetical protein [Austropuccinia psidii MF-1]